jgi:hypothetical protein
MPIDAEGKYIAECAVCERTAKEVTLFPWSEYGLCICSICQVKLTHPTHLVGAWRALGRAIEGDHIDRVKAYHAKEAHHAAD